MKKISLAIALVATSVLSTAAYAAPVVVDDFNNGIVDGWTDQAGTANENGGQRGGTSISLGTMDGIASNSIGVDAIGGGYVALVLNYNNLNDNLFVKIQDNNGNGLFDRVYFYHGNNGGNGIQGTDYFDLAQEVTSSYFQVTDNGDGTVSAYVGATGETFGGTMENSYSGTGVGLGFWQNAKADNFYAIRNSSDVPAPGSLGLMGLSLLGLGLLRRKKA